MGSLRSRLILSHLLPLLIVIPLAGLILIYTLETQVVLKDLSDRLTERADLIVEALEGQPEIWTDSDQAAIFIADINEIVEGQFLLLKSDGSLIISFPSDSPDSSADSAQLEGIDTALRGEQSVIIQYRLFNPSVEVLLPVIDARQQLVGIVAVSQTLESIFSNIGDVRSLILVIILIQLIFGVIIGIYLARKIERPIGTAAAGVIDIAAGVDIGTVPEEGPREIRQLSAAVNTLSERLRTLEETRRRSLANIVHELGRPLGAIQSAVHILLKGTVDTQIERELLEGVDGEVKRMQPLLDDLALLHGQVTGSLTLDLNPVNVGDWLKTSILPWRAAALEKGLHWSAEFPENLPVINIDEGRMAQVLGNLLSNAVKYTPEAGSVMVSAGTEESEVWYRVSDSGSGIDPAEREHIFEPFYRSQKMRRFPQGLGLGLTIARDIVEAHGGKLELTSELGQGSQFTVRLPLNLSP
ncbi:MAG: HAMP domain-containing histidine kinase [Anaerolineales bacterium]|nr:HAMP domain-containing histidine kinase [Anaerolineales bacterium]